MEGDESSTRHVVESGRSDKSPPDGDDVFNARELAFIERLAEGQTIREASKGARVAYNTARRWRKRADVQAAIRERAREAVQAGTLSLGQGASVAAKTLRGIAVLRHPVIRAPSRGDPEQKVRSKACSRVSAPTSGVWSASEQTRFRTACRGMAIHVDVAMANTCGDQAARRS